MALGIVSLVDPSQVEFVLQREFKHTGYTGGPVDRNLIFKLPVETGFCVVYDGTDLFLSGAVLDGIHEGCRCPGKARHSPKYRKSDHPALSMEAYTKFSDAWLSQGSEIPISDFWPEQFPDEYQEAVRWMES